MEQIGRQAGCVLGNMLDERVERHNRGYVRCATHKSTRSSGISRYIQSRTGIYSGLDSHAARRGLQQHPIPVLQPKNHVTSIIKN